MPAGPRRPTRRGSETRSTMPHDSASARARLAARWLRPKRLADLALGERLLSGHEVGLDAGDGRRDTPRRAHLAPCLREVEADGFRGARSGRSSLGGVHNLLCEGSTLEAGPAGARAPG